VGVPGWLLTVLQSVGDPVTNLPIGKTADNLKSAIEGETHVLLILTPFTCPSN
jgi:hypothetical protein